MQPIKVEDRIFQADRNVHVGAGRRVGGPVRDDRHGRRKGRRVRRWLARGSVVLSVVFALIAVFVFAPVKPLSISSLTERGLKLADTLAEQAGFGVVQISLKGHRYAPDADIFASLGQTDRRSIFGFNLARATRSLNKLAWVERAHITRRFPDELLVEIEETRPFAVWRVGRKYWLIDAKGVKLAPLTNQDFAQLPFVTGARGNLNIAGFEKILTDFPGIKARISSLSYIGGRRWTVNFKSGQMVHLPEDNARGALQRLSRLKAKNNILGLNVASIDLRLNDRVTIKNKPARNADADRHPGQGKTRQASLRASAITPGDRAILALFQAHAPQVLAPQAHAPLAAKAAQQSASGG